MVQFGNLPDSYVLLRKLGDNLLFDLSWYSLIEFDKPAMKEWVFPKNCTNEEAKEVVFNGFLKYMNDSVIQYGEESHQSETKKKLKANLVSWENMGVFDPTNSVKNDYKGFLTMVDICAYSKGKEHH